MHMVVWVILKNVKLQDFWINFCSILKACIEKVSWQTVYFAFEVRYSTQNEPDRT